MIKVFYAIVIGIVLAIWFVGVLVVGAVLGAVKDGDCSYNKSDTHIEITCNAKEKVDG